MHCSDKTTGPVRAEPSCIDRLSPVVVGEKYRDRLTAPAAHRSPTTARQLFRLDATFLSLPSLPGLFIYLFMHAARRVFHLTLLPAEFNYFRHYAFRGLDARLQLGMYVYTRLYIYICVGRVADCGTRERESCDQCGRKLLGWCVS